MFCNTAEPNNEYYGSLILVMETTVLRTRRLIQLQKKLDDSAINSTFPLQAESDMTDLQASDQKTENSENKSYNFVRTDMATKMFNYYIQ